MGEAAGWKVLGAEVGAAVVAVRNSIRKWLRVSDPCQVRWLTGACGSFDMFGGNRVLMKKCGNGKMGPCVRQCIHTAHTTLTSASTKNGGNAGGCHWHISEFLPAGGFSSPGMSRLIISPHLILCAHCTFKPKEFEAAPVLFLHLLGWRSIKITASQS
jgi:hypothetical protein